eukprot:m.270519 g.270519  ORF g.270519 m.270519 type:complete len:363 (+) comp22830_c3_seq21:2153-3241(+)
MENKQNTPIPMIAGVATGVVWGFLFEKTKVYLPEVIIQQFHLKSFVMMKVFLSAVGGGMIAFALLESLGKKRLVAPLHSLGSSGWLGNLMGGAVLGAGMAVGGACPGTAFMQLGVGIKSAYFAIFGGVCGAVLFAYLLPVLQANISSFLLKGERKSLDQVLGVGGKPLLLAGGTLLVSAAVALEHFFPWKNAVHALFPQADLGTGVVPHSLGAVAWAPQVAVLLGLVQFVAVLVAQNRLGASSAYCTMAVVCTDGLDSKRRAHAPYLDSFYFHSYAFQVCALVGVALGAQLSVQLSGIAPATVSHVPILRAYWGGLLAVAGARMAGGCPSGHGLTGMAQLGLASIAAVAGMFMGGFAVAAVL